MAGAADVANESWALDVLSWVTTPVVSENENFANGNADAPTAYHLPGLGERLKLAPLLNATRGTR